MPIEPKQTYFHIYDSTDCLIIDDRLSLIWKEILVTLLSFLIVFYLISNNLILTILLSLFIGSLYLLFRFFAYFLYSEIRIDKRSYKISRRRKFFSKLISIEVIDNSFSIDKVKFEEINRSGNNKFLFRYKTHKTHDLMVIRNLYDKEQIFLHLNKIAKSSEN